MLIGAFSGGSVSPGVFVVLFVVLVALGAWSYWERTHRLPVIRGTRRSRQDGNFRKNEGVQDYCDWCYGMLTDQDRSEYFNQFLNQVDAYACSSCIRNGRVLDPPDSLQVPDTIPPDTWCTAAVAIFDQDSNGDALELLRNAAGFL
jgi:hypothetical protein